MFPISTAMHVTEEAPYPRQEFVAVELTHLRGPYSTVVYIFGGWCHGENNDEVSDKYFNDSFLLHICVEYVHGVKTVQLKWEKIHTTGTPPCPRAGTAATLHNGKLIFFGGGRLWTDEALHNDCFSLDTATWQWTYFPTEHAPTPCQSHALLKYRDKIVLMGGTDNMTPPLHEHVYILNVESAVWTMLPITNDAMEELYGLSHFTPLVSSNNDIYVFGGAAWNGDVAHVSKEFYRIKSSRNASMTFSKRPAPVVSTNVAPAPRFAYAACMVNDTIIMHGGWGFRDAHVGDIDDPSIYFSNTFTFDTASSTWEAISTSIGARFGHKMLHLESLGLIVTMMGRDGSNTFGDVIVHSTTDLAKAVQVPSGSAFYIPNSIQSQMLEMYRSGHMVDACISIRAMGRREAREFRIHKAFLGARSPVFRVMFSDQFSEGAAGKRFAEVEFPREDGTGKDLERFLLAVYGESIGKLVQSFKELMSLLTLSSKYQVLDIKYECEMILATKTTYGNLLDVLQYADADSCPYLTNRCVQLLKANPKYMKQKPYLDFCKHHNDIASIVAALVRDQEPDAANGAESRENSNRKKPVSRKRKR